MELFLPFSFRILEFSDFGCCFLKENRIEDADRPENILCGCFHVDASFACSVNIYAKGELFYIEFEFLMA